MGIVRRGIHKPLEDVADAMIKESLKNVTKHSEKSDILTTWKQAERYRREVYPSNGVADNTRKGNFHRALNPARPHLNSREGTAPRASGLSSIQAHVRDYYGDDWVHDVDD